MNLFDEIEQDVITEAERVGAPIGSLTLRKPLRVDNQMTLSIEPYSDLKMWYSATTQGGIMRASDLIELGRGTQVLTFKKDGGDISHSGYIMHKDNTVYEVFCNCDDFFYRCWYALVHHGLSRWAVPSHYNPKGRKYVIGSTEYTKDEFGNNIFKVRDQSKVKTQKFRSIYHNRMRPNKTNPFLLTNVCKHIHIALGKI